MSEFALNGLLIGEVRPLGPDGDLSGIAKHPVSRPLVLGVDGFLGDAQGDQKRHGGPEKAVHHYPLDHYRAWSLDIGAHRLLREPGAFGENLSTTGLTEQTAAVGDVFELGTATIEISQGRQPCWKLNHRFGQPTMAKLVQTTGRTGWYYRVLRAGVVKPSDHLRLIERQSPEWTIERIWRAFYVAALDFDELAALAELPRLAEGWRNHARRRIDTRAVEDWTKRLTGRDGSAWHAEGGGPAEMPRDERRRGEVKDDDPN